MVDNNTPDNTEVVTPDTTPDNTGQEQENANALEGIGDEFQEAKRSDKLASKEVAKYQELIKDGEVDYDGIAKVYRGNAISEKALQSFCEANGLNIEDVKSKMETPEDKLKKMEQRMAELEGKLMEKAETQTFEQKLQAQLAAKGISVKEFAQYRDLFQAELKALTGLDEDVAIRVALDLSAGKKPKQTVVTPDSDAKPLQADGETWTKEFYLSFLSKRSQAVGDTQATKELEKYEADQKAKGLPLYK